MGDSIRNAWMTAVKYFLMALLFLAPVITFAKEQPKTIKDSLLANARLALDFSSRGVLRDEDDYLVNVVGVDYHQTISINNKDFATLIAQPYWVYFSNSNYAPNFFDGNKSELTWRITNINFKLNQRGRANLRVGHFEIPFGLEQFVDTNGTLRQYTFSDRNIKADWGVTLNGITGKLDYEVALSRGSGNDISNRGNPGIFAARAGYAPNRQSVFGLSIFNGDVQVAQGIKQHRMVGMDFSYFVGKYQVMSELSFGELDDQKRSVVFSEWGWNNRSETSSIYLQLRKRWSETAGDDLSFYALGTSYFVSRNVSVSGQINWSKSDVSQRVRTALIQCRLRI